MRTIHSSSHVYPIMHWARVCVYPSMHWAGGGVYPSIHWEGGGCLLRGVSAQRGLPVGVYVT